jgi:hypothetical protein
MPSACARGALACEQGVRIPLSGWFGSWTLSLPALSRRWKPSNSRSLNSMGDLLSVGVSSLGVGRLF